MMKPRGGRPTRLNPQIQEHIVAKIREGVFPQVAAAQCGIASTTFQEWMKKDKQPYIDFQVAVDVAIAEKRGECEATVALTDPKFWLRNAARDRGPDNPGWSDRVEIDGHQKHEHVHATLEQLHAAQLAKLTDEELDALESIQAKLLPAPDDSDSDGEGEA